jgi:3-isopropylmalate/(R)-2-methylmalate dehydratase large subunit
MRIVLRGEPPEGVTSKDIVLSLIAKIGAAGASGYVVEYAGPLVSRMSMEERMTVCNMTIEGGGRAGMVAPDEEAFAYLEGRRYAPSGDDWKRAVETWRTLGSDPDAEFDMEHILQGDELAPTVTWGTSPEDAVPVTGTVPDPAVQEDPGRRARWIAAMDYMGLSPGMRMSDLDVDRVFIGSCTNGRIEDLRHAAAVVKGHKVRVPALVVPGSTAVKQQAEAEGLDRVFVEAGFEWRASGCSMCLGVNGDIAQRGERCASTSNRNFQGRQGPGARTHLMSPAMAAAAAVAGKLIDFRNLAAPDAVARGENPT